jgi:hypothetical protein
MDDLKDHWQIWEAMPYPSSQYPPGSDDGVVDGVDLALVDGDASKILTEFFIYGGLEDDSRAMLSHALDGLERAVPLLAEPAVAYFGLALSLLQAVDGLTHSN